MASSNLSKFGSIRKKVCSFPGETSKFGYPCLTCNSQRILDSLAPESDSIDDHDDDSLETASVIISPNGRPPSAIAGTRVPNYESYRLRLEGLEGLEERLARLLSSPEEDEPTHLGPARPSWEDYNPYQGHEVFSSPPPVAMNGRPSPTITIPHKKQSHSYTNSKNSFGQYTSRFKSKEISVHTSWDWKKTFSLGGNVKSPISPHTGEIEGWWKDPDDPVHVLNACAPPMLELWRDPKVRARLQEKRMRLEESSGLFV